MCEARFFFYFRSQRDSGAQSQKLMKKTWLTVTNWCFFGRCALKPQQCSFIHKPSRGGRTTPEVRDAIIVFILQHFYTKYEVTRWLNITFTDGRYKFQLRVTSHCSYSSRRTESLECQENKMAWLEHFWCPTTRLARMNQTFFSHN